MAKRSVTWQQLKDMYSDEDEGALREAAIAEGIEVPDDGEVQKEEQEIEGGDNGQEKAEETQSAESTSTDAEEDEEEEVDPKTKKGLIAAKQRERDKRKAAEAELAAIRTELEQMRKAPVTQQAPAPAPAPVQQQQPASREEYINRAVETEMASIEPQIRKKLGIELNEDIDNLQFIDGKKYRQYIKDVAKAELRIEQREEKKIDEAEHTYQENMKYIQSFNSKPNAKVVVQYVLNEIAEMQQSEDPLEMAKADVLTRIYSNVNTAQATPQELKVFAKFAEQCEQKLNPSPLPAPEQRGASPLPNAGGKPDKLEQLSAGTRTQQLRSGSVANMTEAELSRLLDDPENLAQISPAILNKYKRGY